MLDFGELDKYSHQLPPYSVVVCLDVLRNIKSQGHESNFIRSFSLSFVAIMGWDDFLPCWDTCWLGDECTLQCPTVSLNTGTAPFILQSFFLFSKKYFGSSCSPSFNSLWILLVQESFCSGDRFQRLLFLATSSLSVSRLSFPFYFIFLHLSCTSSSWGVKGLAFTLFSLFR